MHQVFRTIRLRCRADARIRELVTEYWPHLVNHHRVGTGIFYTFSQALRMIHWQPDDEPLVLRVKDKRLYLLQGTMDAILSLVHQAARDCAMSRPSSTAKKGRNEYHGYTSVDYSATMRVLENDLSLIHI